MSLADNFWITFGSLWDNLGMGGDQLLIGNGMLPFRCVYKGFSCVRRSRFHAKCVWALFYKPFQTFHVDQHGMFEKACKTKPKRTSRETGSDGRMKTLYKRTEKATFHFRSKVDHHPSQGYPKAIQKLSKSYLQVTPKPTQK